MESNKDSEVSLTSIFSLYQKRINVALQTFVDEQGSYDMYKHMSYFLGFLNEEFKRSSVGSGKRFRSSLVLLLADYYDDFVQALAPALSIELFHNFTLIHDDIVDNDEVRRGRPTVWALWGKAHAINSGDAQLLLSNIILSKDRTLLPKTSMYVLQFLNERYLEVTEGQHLDFLFSEYDLGDERLTRDLYMEMITKKSAVLVGASTAVAGVATKQSDEEVERLYSYGVALGTAYQLRDDFLSIWAEATQTGKNKHGDIYEGKKTLPILYAQETLTPEDLKEFLKLYNKKEKSEEEVLRIVELLETTDVCDQMKKEIQEYKKHADSIVDTLMLSDDQKNTLRRVNILLLSL